MRRTMIPTLCVLVLLSCMACGDGPSSSEARRERIQRVQREAKRNAKDDAKTDAKTDARPAPPDRILITWDTKLRTAPERYAPALILAPPPPSAEGQSETEPSAVAEAQTPEQRGRVVRVLGEADEAGDWWRIDTASGIEGLEFYALDLYVPAGTGEALADAGAEPSPTEPPPEADVPVLRTIGTKSELGGGSSLMALIEAADSSAGSLPVQTGDARTPSVIEEWHVAADAKVYWPNGEAAGEVREAHAFVEAGEELHVSGRALTCFAARVGPPRKRVAKLCFPSEAVTKAAPPPPPVSDLFGDARILAELEAMSKAMEAAELSVITNDELGVFSGLEGIAGLGVAEALDQDLDQDDGVGEPSGGSVDAPD